MTNNLNNRSDPIFETEDYFLLRTPFKSLDYFKHMSNLNIDELLRFLKNDQQLIEAIAVSSPNLHSMITNNFDSILEHKSSKKSRQVISSLIRYAVRGSTRPTPFGLFSAVKSGGFDKATTLDIQIDNNFESYIRPDMGWLLGVVKDLESRDHLINYIKVKINQSLHKVGHRLYVRFMVSHGQSTTKDTEISVSLTEVLEKVLDLASDSIGFYELKSEIERLYPKVDSAIIHNYLKQLIEKEVLITELKPPLNDVNPLDYLAIKIHSISDNKELNNIDTDYIQKVLSIKTSIEQFNKLQNSLTYYELCQGMNSIYSSPNPLQLDSFIPGNSFTLPSKIKEDVADAATCLWQLNQATKDSILEDYKNKFIEKYGVYQEVPLLDVISSEKGLGYPSSYYEKESDQESKLDELLTSMNATRQITLSNLVNMSIKQDESEINLTDDLMDKLTTKNNDKEVPEGVDLYAEIIKDKEQGYIISCNSQAGAQGVGKSFGRFLYNDQELQERFIISHQKIIEQSPSLEYIELSYIPPIGKSANVMQGVTPTRYSLNLTSIGQKETNIDLDDLYLVADAKKMIIRSKSLDKEVRIITSNMFNYNNAPRLCRFLLELTQDQYASWSIFNWQLSQFSNYLPRIKRGKVILYPKTWRFHKGILDTNKEYEGLSIEESIKRWVRVWNVPRYVYLTFSDLRLLIDLENDIQLKEVISEVKKKGQFELQEFIGDFNDRLVESKEGKHAMEVVFSLTRKNAPASEAFPLVQAKHSNVRRTIHTGEECLSFKLYGALNGQDDFIRCYLLDFMNELKQKKIIEKWFYIRYFDPEPHVRLRIFGDPDKLTTSALREVNHFIKETIQEGYLKDYSIVPYERELERYGGESLINKVEELFWADSIVTGKLLHSLNQKDGSLLNKKEILAVINVVDLLDGFGLSNSEIYQRIFYGENAKVYMEKYRIAKKELMKYLNRENEWAGLRETSGGVEILALFETRRQITKELKSLAAEDIESGKMGQQENFLLVDSLIHMTCNRLLGAGVMEDEVRALIHLTLKSLSYFKKQSPEKVLIK